MASPVLRRVQSLEEMMADLVRAQARTDEQLQRTDEQLARMSQGLDEFKEFTRASIERSDREAKRMSQQWGALSNKMGTMAEDLVAPSIPRILQETVGCPEGRLDFVGIRMRSRSTIDPARTRELDVMAACGNYLLVNETKSSLDAGDIQQFVDVLPTVPEYFPQYANHQIIGAIASLYVPEDVVRYGERQGLIVLGWGDWSMDVLNSEGFHPKNFAPAA